MEIHLEIIKVSILLLLCNTVSGQIFFKADCIDINFNDDYIYIKDSNRDTLSEDEVFRFFIDIDTIIRDHWNSSYIIDHQIFLSGYKKIIISCANYQAVWNQELECIVITVDRSDNNGSYYKTDTVYKYMNYNEDITRQIEPGEYKLKSIRDSFGRSIDLECQLNKKLLILPDQYWIQHFSDYSANCTDFPISDIGYLDYTDSLGINSFLHTICRYSISDSNNLYIFSDGRFVEKLKIEYIGTYYFSIKNSNGIIFEYGNK